MASAPPPGPSPNKPRPQRPRFEQGITVGARRPLFFLGPAASPGLGRGPSPARGKRSRAPRSSYSPRSKKPARRGEGKDRARQRPGTKRLATKRSTHRASPGIGGLAALSPPSCPRLSRASTPTRGGDVARNGRRLFRWRRGPVPAWITGTSPVMTGEGARPGTGSERPRRHREEGPKAIHVSAPRRVDRFAPLSS